MFQKSVLHIERTLPDSSAFIALIGMLDSDLAIYDGDDHAFYDQYNQVDAIKHVVVAYIDQEPVACGAIKKWDEHTMEIKRMFVRHDHRGNGFSKIVLAELERWAHELSFARCILETGKVQKEAVALYHRAGYLVCDNYGPYVGIDNSVCFEKQLNP